MVSPPDQHVSSLAKQARERFVVQVGRALPEMVKACDMRLTSVLDQPGTAREVQLRRDAWTAFQKNQTTWLNQSRKALQRTLLPRASVSAAPLKWSPAPGRLELVAEGVMDNQIMASRLAMQVLDVASAELNDLRLRVQHLENRQELPRGDVLLPDVTARILVDQWLAAELPREAWPLINDALVAVMAPRLLEAYQAANSFLVTSGVMKQIDLNTLVKRAPGSRSSRPLGRAPAPADADSSGDALHTGGSTGAGGGFGPGSVGGAGFAAGSGVGSGHETRPGAPGAHGTRGHETGSGLGSQVGSGGLTAADRGVHDETRMMTGSTPLARARMRAQGVVGRLKRLLMEKIGGDFEATQVGAAPSSVLQQAIQRSALAARQDAGPSMDGGTLYADASHVHRAATALRERTQELKQAASTPSEKATIEVVALMFQSILAEERIPPSVRVWFARLQMPVLRVALAEPEFFSALEHPARRLIDRMGSCVLGFESDVSAGALEVEIKRVVQVIEQYPETGRRVFQLVFDEFQKFLASYLSEQSGASRFISVAQQVEQKETLSVQYTIELRKLLNDMPVRDEVREFLFKVWVEVLAVAGVKLGQRHEETVALKQVASDLLWAASAKPSRSERARVIQQLPSLLQRLRQGMGMLGYPPSLQDRHIKSVSDTLADAFMSRTDAIPQESLDRLAARLAHLEDYLPEGGVGDLDLDSASIELITGVDAGNIEVIMQGGSPPSEAMRGWAMELQTGSWFGLDHNGQLSNVQLAWRSERGQLCLFVTTIGRCYLIQSARVASYLQAGLLVPTEEEALTVRATRDALAKLDANPERLLA